MKKKNMTKKKKILIFVCVFVVAVLFIAFALLMWFTSFSKLTELEVKGNEIWMNGIINGKTLDQFTEILDTEPQIDTLVLESSEGSLNDDAMIELAYMLRERGLNTRLKPDSDIASGAVDLFLSGKKRFIQVDGHVIPKIGVHSWKELLGGKEAREIPKDDPDHQKNRTYIEDMLGHDDFYWFTIYNADADDIYLMDLWELSQYNIYTHLEDISTGGNAYNPETFELLEKLRNSRVGLPDDPDTLVSLTTGRGQFDITDGTSGGIYVWPRPFALWESGDKQDLIALVSVNTGGTGRFFYLVLFDVHGSSPVQKSYQFLGDRIRVEKIVINDSDTDDYSVLVTVLNRKDNEAMSIKPTVSEEKYFGVKNQQLQPYNRNYSLNPNQENSI